MKTLKASCFCLFLTFLVSNSVSGQIRATLVTGDHCLEEAIIVPIEVENFDSVGSFQLKLSFDSEILLCEGYTNANPQIADNLSGYILSTGLINLTWNSDIPVSLDGTITLMELVFTPKIAGETDLEWFNDPLDSYFKNIDNEFFIGEFISGTINIHEIPEIILPFTMTAYEGDTITISATVTGGQPPITHFWTNPDGHNGTEDPYFAGITLADSGDYTLTVTDSVGCTDQETIHLSVIAAQNIVENYSTSLVIFPNPSKGQFIIDLPVSNASKAYLNVINAAGLIIFNTTEVLLPQASHINLDLSILSDGLYVIELTIDSRKYYGKLLMHHH